MTGTAHDAFESWYRGYFAIFEEEDAEEFADKRSGLYLFMRGLSFEEAARTRLLHVFTQEFDR